MNDPVMLVSVKSAETDGRKLRCVYSDLDGTLLGRGGSLFHDADGYTTMAGARAVEACNRADVELVLFSGRNKHTVFDVARVIGQQSYIYEAGCGLVVDGEEELLTGELVPSDGSSIHDQITECGAPALLLEHYEGKLEYHEPWHVGRKISHLFRGVVDAAEADKLLDEHGLGHLRLLDNGTIHRRSETLTVDEQPRAYHLIPRVASKARAVARHMQARGFAAEECIAVGDSREDLGAAAFVGEFWLVANAIRKDPTLRNVIADLPNVRVADESNGAGVYEAVMTALAVRR